MTTLTEQIDGIQLIWKDNDYKLNAADCSPNLTTSENGFILKHSGQFDEFGQPIPETNCIRANLPIPSLNNKIEKPTIAFYFEVQIRKNTANIGIGFCDQQFPLDGHLLGWQPNSIGMDDKDGIFVEFNENGDNIETENGLFTENDVVGLGIIHLPNSKLECFATLNGKLIDKFSLDQKFLNIQLFPAIELCFEEDAIQVNFGKEKWQFNDFKSLFNDSAPVKEDEEE